MRYSLLDIKTTPNGRTPQAATMVRMDIQPRNWLRRRQGDRQLQFCVPLVSIGGDSYRAFSKVGRQRYCTDTCRKTGLNPSLPTLEVLWERAGIRLICDLIDDTNP